MKITFFRFNVEPAYWEAVEKFLQNNKVGEMALRECLRHCSTNFIIEKASRYVTDQITDGRDIYSHQSQRYVNFKNKLEYDKDDFFYIPDEIIEKGYAEDFRKYTKSMIKKYCTMVDNGIPPEDARFFLPGSFYSNIKISLHGDRLLDFVIYNYYQDIQEHKLIAQALLDKIGEKYEVLVNTIIKIVKSKQAEMEDVQKAKDLWKSMLKPGEFNIFFHNEPVLESSLGASICYRGGSPSEYIDDFNTDKQEKLLKKIIAAKHESVTEHAFFSIQCSLSRIIHQQLRRHRISTRSYTYILDAAQDFSYIIPPKIKEHELGNELFIEGMEESREMYKYLIEKGVSKEEASYVLPNAIKLDIVITTNLRDVKHILKQRLCERAQWEIRDLAYKIFEELYKTSPLLFSDIGPSCYFDKCKEGEFSCGKPHIFKNFVERLQQEIEQENC